jgi:DNA polymerase-3 subunit epsilon
MLENVLILDSETSGKGGDAKAIEVACILYSVRHAAPIRYYASLIRAESNAAYAVNKIPSTMLADAPHEDWVWADVTSLATRAGAILAHNALFDRRFVPGDVTGDLPWICSMDDLAWPCATRPGEGLVSLALAHGLGVSHAHRAMADCDLLARLLTRVAEMGHDLQAFLARGLRPKALFQAVVPYERRAEASEAGFKWEADTKRWLRTMAIEDVAALSFPTRQVEAGGNVAA